MPDSIRVAVIQLFAQPLAHAEDVWGRLENRVAEAAAAGARLVVTPECTYPAYWLGSADRLRSGSVLSRPAVLERFTHFAAAHRVTLVGGFAEDDGSRIFNAAAVFEPGGRCAGIYRKTLLWDCDCDWFSPGDELQPIETAVGRLGVLICADVRSPESAATLVNRGAELIAVPTAWVNTSGEPGRLYSIQADFLVEARAREFGVPFICADKWGREPPLEYVGRSRIVAGGGRLMAEAGETGDACAVADVSPGAPRGSVAPPDLQPLLDGSGRRLPAIDGPVLVRIAAGSTDPVDPDHADVSLAGDEIRFRSSARAAVLSTSVRRLRSAEIVTFHATRAAALAGVRLCLVPGVGPDQIVTLRARAAENRMFIGATARGGSGGWLISPDGSMLASAAGPNACVSASVDLNLADDKHVTPKTDLWAQRRPRLYRLTP